MNQDIRLHTFDRPRVKHWDYLDDDDDHRDDDDCDDDNEIDDPDECVDLH